MKFKEKYPNAINGEMVESTLLVGDSNNCIMCGKLTPFIDIDFEAHVCSDECMDKLLFDYAVHSSQIHNNKFNIKDFEF